MIELLVVIVILGIIAAIAIPAIGSLIDNSKKDAHIANAEQMASAARMAIAQDGNGTKTFTMAALISKGYLEGIPGSQGTQVLIVLEILKWLLQFLLIQSLRINFNTK